jgi:hypothetical protein
MKITFCIQSEVTSNLHVLVFWWRVLNEYIPSRGNLHKRHIDPLATCEVCGAAAESTFHALVECMFARQFWYCLKLSEGIKLPKLCLVTWAADLIKGDLVGEDKLGIILCGMWPLWCLRNDRRHGKDVIENRLAIQWVVEACALTKPDWKSEKGCR